MGWDAFLKSCKDLPLLTERGFPGSAYALFLCEQFKSLEKSIFCTLEVEDEARTLAMDLRRLLPPRQVLFFPAYDRLEEELLPPSALTVFERLSCLRQLIESNRPVILVTTPESQSQLTLPRDRFRDLSLQLKVGLDLAWDKLLRKLVSLGYQRVEMVASRGEFAVRGDILDVFPSTDEEPVRCEFFGDSLDEMKTFEVYSQRSKQSIKRLTIYPVQEFDSQGFKLCKALPVELQEFFESRSEGADLQELSSRSVPGLEWLNPYVESSAPVESYRLDWLHPETLDLNLVIDGVPSFGKNMEWYLKTIEEKVQAGFQVLLLLPKSGFLKRIRGLLKSRSCPVVTATSLKGDLGSRSGVILFASGIRRGFEIQSFNLCVLTYADFTGVAFQESGERKTESVFEGDLLHHFSELKERDYVVHVDHGVAHFQGLENIIIDGVRKEFLVLQFQGSDRVLVPITEVDRIHRYTAEEGRPPKVNKLNSVRWSQVKNRVKKDVQEFARELLHQYAKRSVAKGYAYSKDTEVLQEMEAAFEHQETVDQNHVLTEIKKDMEGVCPMDRLLCGDVGFGKTEVAIRAAFKAVQDGKQVAVLCPTTILSQQHFQTFQSRLMGYKVRIEVLNRFVSPKEARRVLKDLELQKIDILIGTHRILSKDIHFISLGLLIVDEEQRFGVKHKEKLKKLKIGVDSLTLSATPIPRTLHLSLAGARSISLIQTPPPGRLPIKTFVLPFQPPTIKRAVERELKRKGQIFYIYNQVETIQSKASQLAGLIPGLRLRYLHGQMDAKTIEETMTAFLQREFDVLLATTIVESGMDIPNVNTILVERADAFGLSQLYQLRGRIGRRETQGFAYLFYRPGSGLSMTARKRLMALEEFTDLGSGFKIAMRDLEIRGAGNLLGKQQSGFVYSVGFDLYTRLLRDAIEKLRDGNYQEEWEMPRMELRVNSYVDDKYIPSYTERMDFFRRISNLKSIAALEELTHELMDRYGGFSASMQELLSLVRLRIYGYWMRVHRFKQLPRSLLIEFHGPVESTLLRDFSSHFGAMSGFESRFPDRLVLKLQGESPAKVLELLLAFFNQERSEAYQAP
jgi:transcription-repair coupling factor (superfamily II helicase)